MRFLNPVLPLLLAGPLVMAVEPPTPPSFTKKPVAAKAGDSVKIEFATSRETDVAIFIEDGKGQVIRHLVAGVLGKSPPAPLKAGAARRGAHR
jgi:hypothetical protein